MVSEVDTELFISLLELQPALWCKSVEKYKDREETRKAWKEVCVGLKPDFEEWRDSDRNAFGKFIMSIIVLS
jgi:hypothetical protein